MFNYTFLDCDDPVMLACFDGSCITTDEICNGVNSCDNPEILEEFGVSEDEFGCIPMGA